MESRVDCNLYLVMAMTPEQQTTYGVGIEIVERMWSGQGCCRGGNCRGLGG